MRWLVIMDATTRNVTRRPRAARRRHDFAGVTDISTPGPTAMADTDPYVILGIDPDATPEQIRAAFRKAVVRAHPDT